VRTASAIVDRRARHVETTSSSSDFFLQASSHDTFGKSERERHAMPPTPVTHGACRGEDQGALGLGRMFQIDAVPARRDAQSGMSITSANASTSSSISGLSNGSIASPYSGGIADRQLAEAVLDRSTWKPNRPYSGMVAIEAGDHALNVGHAAKAR